MLIRSQLSFCRGVRQSQTNKQTDKQWQKQLGRGKRRREQKVTVWGLIDDDSLWTHFGRKVGQFKHGWWLRGRICHYFTLKCNRIELKTCYTSNNRDTKVKIQGCTESYGTILYLTQWLFKYGHQHKHKCGTAVKYQRCCFQNFLFFTRTKWLTRSFQGPGELEFIVRCRSRVWIWKWLLEEKKNKKNMKLLLLFTKVVVVMLMAFRMKKAKHAEVPNENIKTNTIWWKKRKGKPGVESQERQRDGITAGPIHASLNWYF